MPRATKSAIRLAQEIGETASQVQGWLEAGYGPTGDGDIADHFRRLAPLMGTGRDGDVAVIKMAVQGLADRRLRDVFAELQVLDPDEDTSGPDAVLSTITSSPMFAATRSTFVALAGEAGTPIEADYQQVGEVGNVEPEQALSEVRANAAMLEVLDAHFGHSTEREDLAEMSDLIDASATRLAGSDGGHNREFQTKDAAIVDYVVSASHAVIDWIENASPEELCQGAQASERLVDGLSFLGFLNFNGDEERWRWVGRLAPTASNMLELVLAMTEMLRQFTPDSPVGVKAFIDVVDPKGLAN